MSARYTLEPEFQIGAWGDEAHNSILLFRTNAALSPNLQRAITATSNITTETIHDAIASVTEHTDAFAEAARIFQDIEFDWKTRAQTLVLPLRQLVQLLLILFSPSDRAFILANFAESTQRSLDGDAIKDKFKVLTANYNNTRAFDNSPYIITTSMSKTFDPDELWSRYKNHNFVYALIHFARVFKIFSRTHTKTDYRPKLQPIPTTTDLGLQDDYLDALRTTAVPLIPSIPSEDDAMNLVAAAKRHALFSTMQQLTQTYVRILEVAELRTVANDATWDPLSAPPEFAWTTDKITQHFTDTFPDHNPDSPDDRLLTSRDKRKYILNLVLKVQREVQAFAVGTLAMFGRGPWIMQADEDPRRNSRAKHSKRLPFLRHNDVSLAHIFHAEMKEDRLQMLEKVAAGEEWQLMPREYVTTAEGLHLFPDTFLEAIERGGGDMKPAHETCMNTMKRVFSYNSYMNAILVPEDFRGTHAKATTLIRQFVIEASSMKTTRRVVDEGAKMHKPLPQVRAREKDANSIVMTTRDIYPMRFSLDDFVGYLLQPRIVKAREVAPEEEIGLFPECADNLGLLRLVAARIFPYLVPMDEDELIREFDTLKSVQRNYTLSKHPASQQNAAIDYLTFLRGGTMSRLMAARAMLFAANADKTLLQSSNQGLELEKWHIQLESDANKGKFEVKIALGQLSLTPRTKGEQGDELQLDAENADIRAAERTARKRRMENDPNRILRALLQVSLRPGSIAGSMSNVLNQYEAQRWQAAGFSVHGLQAEFGDDLPRFERTRPDRDRLKTALDASVRAQFTFANPGQDLSLQNFLTAMMKGLHPLTDGTQSPFPLIQANVNLLAFLFDPKRELSPHKGAGRDTHESSLEEDDQGMHWAWPYGKVPTNTPDADTRFFAAALRWEVTHTRRGFVQSVRRIDRLQTAARRRRKFAQSQTFREGDSAAENALRFGALVDYHTLLLDYAALFMTPRQHEISIRATQASDDGIRTRIQRQMLEMINKFQDHAIGESIAPKQPSMQETTTYLRGRGLGNTIRALTLDTPHQDLLFTNMDTLQTMFLSILEE